jgi:hypothetical protein
VRKLKKFKRYEEGGAVGAGSGDPFAYTDFSDRARNLKKPEAAPIEERKPPKVREEAEPTRAEPVKAEPTKAESKPLKLTKAEERADYEGDTDATSGSQTFKPSARPPVASTSRPAASRPAVEKTPTAPAKPPKAAEKAPEPSSKPIYSGAGDSDDSVDTKKKNEVERLKRVGSGAVEQTMMGPVETVALGVSKLPALARAGFGAARKAYNDLTSPSGGKGTGKFPESKSVEVSDKPAIDRLKEANIQGPPKPPRQETAAEKMGLRETPSMERMRKAKEAAKEGPPAPAKPQTPAEKMGLKETPSMARMRQAKDTANNMGPPKFYSKEPKPTVAEEFGIKETGPMERARKAKEKFDEAAETARKAKPVADDEVVQEAAKRAAASRPRVTPKRQEDSAKFGGGKGTPSKAKTKAEVKPTSNKLKNPVGEKEGPTVDKVLESKGLAAKKGGKIPAFKKGGLVGRGDGCAMRGKTKGRMV